MRMSSTLPRRKHMRPNRHTQRILGSLLAVLLVFASGVVHAQQSPLGQILSGAVQPQPAPRLDRIVQQGVLRVGTTGDFKPFSFLNPATNDYEGHDIDAAKMLAE